MVDVDFILHVSVYDFDKYWYNIRKNKIPGYSTFAFCPNINLIVACYYSVTNLKHHKGNNKITELRTILQRESPNS